MTQLLAHLFGDYILQSDWMAQNKTKNDLAAAAHAFVYTLCFTPLIQQLHSLTRIGIATAVICGSHFLIDRFRLARYVVWAKNWLGPKTFEFSKKPLTNSLMSKSLHGDGVYIVSEMEECWVEGHTNNPTHRAPPLEICPTGYPPSTPIWLSTWLLIVADNTLHLAINYAALRWL